jgi:hypothetical protein
MTVLLFFIYDFHSSSSRIPQLRPLSPTKNIHNQRPLQMQPTKPWGTPSAVSPTVALMPTPHQGNDASIFSRFCRLSILPLSSHFTGSPVVSAAQHETTRASLSPERRFCLCVRTKHPFPPALSERGTGREPTHSQQTQWTHASGPRTRPTKLEP